MGKTGGALFFFFFFFAKGTRRYKKSKKKRRGGRRYSAAVDGGNKRNVCCPFGRRKREGRERAFVLLQRCRRGNVVGKGEGKMKKFPSQQDRGKSKGRFSAAIKEGERKAKWGARATGEERGKGELSLPACRKPPKGEAYFW